jgi:RNA polymerase sigma factor (sigma-70 family)
VVVECRSGNEVAYLREDPPAGDAGGAGVGDGDDDALADIVAAAARGVPSAWGALTHRYGGVITAIARSCRLNEADVAEVYQVTWLRMVENIDRIEHPERIGAWLATTAKRESLRVVRARGRLSFDHDGLLARPDPDAEPLDAGTIGRERAEALRRAFVRLSPHCQRLLAVLMVDDPPPYKEVSETMSMPVGSIGPTRGRCLEHLRRILQEVGADV